MLFEKKKDKDSEVRKRLSKNISEGVAYITKAAVAFDNILRDKEQLDYSKLKASALVVALDSLVKLAGEEDTSMLAYAAAIIQGLASEAEITTKLENQSKIEDQLLKEGKNVVASVPKTIH